MIPPATQWLQMALLVFGAAPPAAGPWPALSIEPAYVRDGAAQSLTVSHDGGCFAACLDGKVRVFDTKSGRLLRELKGSGEFAALVGKENGLLVGGFEKGPLRRLTFAGEEVGRLDFPDGFRSAPGCPYIVAPVGNAITAKDALTGKTAATWKGAGKYDTIDIHSVTADGGVAAVCGNDDEQVLVAWRVPDAKAATLPTEKACNGLALAPGRGGDIAVNYSREPEVEVYSAGFAKQKRILKVPVLSGDVYRLEYTPDGRYLVALFRFNDIRDWGTDIIAWSVMNGYKQVARVRASRQPVYGMACLPDSSGLITFSSGGRREIVVWQFTAK